MHLPDNRGFTLVELLVTISILAILSAVGIIVFTSAQNEARKSATMAEMTKLRDAMIRYKIAKGELPPTGDNCSNCSCGTASTDSDERANYMMYDTCSGTSGTGALKTLLDENLISNMEEFTKDAWDQGYFWDDNDANIPPGSTSPCQYNTQTNSTYLCSSGPDKTWSNGDDLCVRIQCPGFN